jgi:hypothetical protein
MGAVEKYWLPDFERKLREYCRKILKSGCRDEASVFLWKWALKKKTKTKTKEKRRKRETICYIYILPSFFSKGIITLVDMGRGSGMDGVVLPNSSRK